MEVDIVPNSEDLKNDTSFPKYLKKSIKEETTKAKNSTRNKIKEGCKLDEYNVNLNKGDRKRGFTNQDLEKSPDLPVVDRGKELDRVGNGQTINISDGGADVNSLNVVPETPLIAIDSETFITDASNPPQKKNLIRKSRLKKSNKEQTSKKSPVAARCEETHTNRTDTNLSTNMPCAKEKEMSESIIPPSVDMSVSDMVVLEHQSGKEGSESTSTHLSSETQDSQTSAGRKLRSSESTSTQQSNETQNSQDYEERKLRNSDKKRGKRKAASSVIPETPVQGEVKTTEEEVTEMSRKQKENTAIMTDSQQSLSSLCSTQESVSILAPVHKTFEKIVEKNSPASSKENLMAVNRNEGQNKDIIEIKSQETEGDIQEKSSSCEIIAEGESLVMKSENNQSLRSSSYKLRRPKRKCFSLTSPDKGPKMESLARNDVCRVDDEEMVKQNSSKIEKKGKCKEDLEIVNDVKEKKQRIYEKNHSEVKSSEDIKSTPIDALIPTQLSLKSIKKQEMKLKKQQQSSPEDVFLMDSETPVSGSGYQDLVQNQEGLLELELGDLDGVCEMDTGDSQVKSSIERGSGKVDNTVDGDTDHVEKSSNVKKEYSQVKEQTNEYMECGGSSNEETYGESGGKNSESHTVTTIPDTERNEEELLHQKKSRLRSVRDVPGDGDILQMDRKMTENSDSLKNSNSQKNCRTSRSDVSNAGKRAVRGLARKLRQKNVQDPLSVSDECRKLKALDRGDCNREPSNSSREDISIIEKKEKRYQSVEAPVCFGVVPETMEVGLEDLDQVDDEVTTIPETVENSLPGDEEEHDTEMEARTVRDEEGDTDIEDEKTTCIQEKLEQDDIEKRKGKGTGKSQISVKEDSLKMDGIQEGEDNKVNMDIVEPKPEQGTSQGDRNGGTVGDSKTVTKEGSYMETAADDEPLFHSLESSPLPDILEEEDEMQKERLSECALKSGGALPQKKVDPYDSSSSDFDLLPEDIINPEDMTPDNSPRKVEDYNNGNSSVDFVQVWEGKVPSYERDTKSEGMGTKSEKRCEKEEMKNFVDLSDDSDDDDKLIHRGRKWKKVVISDSDDDDDDVDDDDDGNNDEEEEDIGRKKKKKKTAVIISDDEEETGLTEDWKSKTSVTSDEEDDSDFSHSRQMNLTSSSAFSSQSEGYNTQNQVLLRQELERMKKEMAEIESRISKENQNKSLKMKRSPSPAPSQETAEEPYSEYLRELQTEASEGDSPQQSQKIASKIADEIEACDSDDSSDLFLSPAPPSPPPNDPCTLPIVGMKLSENFKETEEFLQEFRNNEKTSQEKFITEQNPGERFRSEGSSDIEAEEGEDWKIERDLSNHSCKTVDPCEIKESLQKSKNRALGKSSQRGNFTDSKEPSVIQESPQSQKPGKSSVARLKDLYHSTPVSSNKKPQRGQKNTLSFLSPVLTPREFPETNEKVQSPLVHRSPEKDNQSKVFVASGLPFNQLNELRRLVQSHDCKFHPKFSPYTTHLIVKTVPPGSRMCERTLKFFQALAYKCWILDYKWVTDSIAAGRLLEEDPYEISGDTVTNDHHCGPQKSRTKSPTDPGILNGIQFYIIGSSQGLSSDDIRDLIETCGGSVVQEPEKLDRDHLCLIITCAALEDSQETAPSQEIILFNRLYRRHGALTVSREWLLDSLTVYNLQPLSEYVLTSVKGMVIPSV
ncbi:breast cancer type 1 susceptibility protein homolog [Saccostrea echinata]|uniref:breast cancer type 1 susceptibility protein homolog n=1 Tax=Saccostrea echinata TaxID=191078 RepID=UPI002A7EE3B2|nr:breast cancer type 1 susceptibility protein homolog [Saccostrea echinata]